MENYVTSNRINYGLRIVPIKMIEIFSPEQWEEFIEEWLDIKRTFYHSIERFGGAGDKGRDVAAFVTDPKGRKDYEWDCYQCKHYDSALAPTKVYIEFGKIIYHSFLKEYPVPRRYYFVSPKDCGTSLSKLLKDPVALKEKVQENWLLYCENEISTFPVKLEGTFLTYFHSFDFSIFDKVQIKTVVEEHKAHSNHLTRFGGGLADRPKLTENDIPELVQPQESVYVDNLLKAYNSCGITVSTIEELSGIHANHFKRARQGFHFAEQLRVLYRDSLPVNTFEDFQEEIYSGVVNLYESSHNDGFEKVKAVEDKSLTVQVTSNPLKDVSKSQDRIGICHQLSNNGKLKWTDG